MIRYAVLALAFATVSAAPAPSPAERHDQAVLDKSLDGLKPGAPLHCLSQRTVSGSQIYGDKILYDAGRSRKWLNQTSGGCSADDDDIIVSRTTMSQYCEGDIITTHDRVSGMITGSCSLGKFVPYTK